ncbi:MAG: CYTH and CHAD domain-containing protein [Ilumatobacteraceae bacterium]
MKTETETETKFDVDEVVVAGLETIDGVASVAAPDEFDLDAEYFDTTDLRLLRANIVLRRRLGGDDEGWHVKLERTPGERTEIHEPAGDDPTSIPESLWDLRVLPCHDAELVPVARVRNHRRVYRLLDGAGAPIAEVCDDHVTSTSIVAGSSAWRELEVELTGDGDRALLQRVGDHLERAGARPSTSRSKLGRALGDPTFDVRRGHIPKSPTAGDVVAAFIDEQVAVMRRLDPAVRIDDPDAVHKMRVAVRRLRSTLATYRRLLDRDVTDPIRDELAWLGGVLGAARDAEVIRSQLLDAVDQQPAELVVGPVRERITATTMREHAEAHRGAMVDLSSRRYLELMAALDVVSERVQGKRANQPAKARLPKEVRRTNERMRAHLDRALDGDRPTDDDLHDVRKAIKRVRYAAEAAAPVVGKRAAEYAERMQDAQEVLGDAQDSVVIRAVLCRVADDAAVAGEPSFTYGRLHAAEEARGRERRDAFLRDVRDGWARRPGWLR